MLINRKKFTIFGLLMLISALALSVPALASAAQTWTVTSAADEPDQTPGNEVCKTAANTCTLRAALEEVEKYAGAEVEQEILFNGTFNGTSAGTIKLGSALPEISRPTPEKVAINGQCLAGSLELRPCVGIEGRAGETTLEAEEGEVTIEGLALTKGETAIKSDESAKLTAVDNWIGIDLAGSLSAATEVSASGIAVAAGSIVEGNEIAGGDVGIETFGSVEETNTIVDNAIEGSGEEGILIASSQNGVRGNVVVGAEGPGILIRGIGTDENSIGSQNREVKGTDPGENVLDDNEGAAIEIHTGTAAVDNQVYRNQGSGNDGKFIAVVPFNGGEKPNKGIQAPEIEAATLTEASGEAESEAAVYLFAKTASELGELGEFLGFVEADPSGEWSMTYAAKADTVEIAATQTRENEEFGSSELKSFALSQVALTVTKAGTGSGTVDSSPSKLSCGPTCTASFAKGGHVTLTGTAAAGSDPVAWTGCTTVNGANQCEVTLSAAKAVTATFNLTPVTPTCATDASLCPPSNTTPPATITPPATTPPATKPVPPKKKPLVCKKGFAKKKVKGKTSCVKVKKHKKKH
jgi:CSLREA domain-containing protein